MIGNVGPYTNENGDWWVPAEVDLNYARHIVSDCVDPDLSIRYEGQVTTTLHEHEPSAFWDDDCEKLGCRKDVRAWRFTAYEIPAVFEKEDDE